MRYRILLFVWIVKATTQVLAQQPFTKNYQTGNGLPSNYLYSVFQDSKGYIWVTTDVGVSRFDGQTFTNFNTSHGLPDNEVFSAIEDRQGRIWFATLNGNSGFYQNGQFYNEHNFPLLRQCQLKGLTLRLFEQDDGRVAYVGAFKTVLIDLDRHQVETRILENGLALAWKEDHNRIGGATKEFGFVEQQGFRPVAKGPSLIQSLNAITIGDTLMISSDRSIYLFNRKDFSLISQKELLPTGNQFIYLSHTGKNLWGGTRSGVLRINAETLAIENHYLPGRAVSCVLEDREGGLWFSTFEEGLFYVPDPAIVQYSIPDGLLYKRVICLSRDSKQQLWIGSEGSAFSVFDGKSIRSNVIFQKIVTNKNIGKIRHFPNDLTLIISKAGTLRIQNGKRELIIQRASDVNIAPNGNYWSGLNGLFIIPPALIKQKSVPANTPVDVEDLNPLFGVRAITKFKGHKIERVEFDGQGVGWIGTTIGLFKLDTNMVDQKILPYSIKDLQFDPKRQKLWVLSESKGLFTIVQGHVSDSIMIRNQFGEVICRDLCLDDAGNLWIGTASGLFRVQEQNGQLALTNFWGVLGLGWDKINAVEVVGNQVYLGKDDGLLAIPQHILLASPPSPPVLIKSVSINNRPIPLTKGQSISLQYGEGSLNIAFEGLSFREPQYIRYRYRLSGLDTLWRETTSEALEYASLRPGKYRFEVYSLNGAGELCSEPGWLTFEVLPPFWMRPWFYALLTGMVGLLLFGYVRRRENRLRKTYEVERERIESGREKAELQKKNADLKMLALRLQMNPHFIFNALNTIKGYYGQDKIVEANAFIGKFARLLRLNLDYSDALIPLDQEIELLRIYLQLSQIRYPDKINFRIEIPPEIQPIHTMIPSMLLQPFVENAVIHGLAPKKSPGEIIISFRMAGEEIFASILDSGIGRETAAKSKLRDLHKPLATQITRERLQLLRGKDAAGPALHIEDLYENKQAAGTLVTLRIPFQLNQHEPHDQRPHH